MYLHAISNNMIHIFYFTEQCLKIKYCFLIKKKNDIFTIKLKCLNNN